MLEAGFRMLGATVGQILDRVFGKGSSPRSITVDHGAEFQSRALEDWAYWRGVQLDFIRPGKPVENAFIESLNSRLRDECVNVHQFISLAETQAIIEAGQVDYNTRRPHSSLGHLTRASLSPNVRTNRSPKQSSTLFKSNLVTGPTSVEGQLCLLHSVA